MSAERRHLLGMCSDMSPVPGKLGLKTHLTPLKPLCHLQLDHSVAVLLNLRSGCPVVVAHETYSTEQTLWTLNHGDNSNSKHLTTWFVNTAFDPEDAQVLSRNCSFKWDLSISVVFFKKWGLLRVWGLICLFFFIPKYLNFHILPSNVDRLLFSEIPMFHYICPYLHNANDIFSNRYLFFILEVKSMSMGSRFSSDISIMLTLIKFL